MIYLDNAATSGKKPFGVIKAVENALNFYSANPGRSGHSESVKAAMLVFSVRKSAAEFFGAEGPEQVVFTPNCTFALNCIIKGVLRKHDHVIISDIEHNAVLRPVHKLYEEGLITYDVAATDLYDKNKTVENFKSLINANTKMIICSGASNVCGILNPIKEIGELCRNNSILFAVDAAQSGGIIKTDMKNMKIDYLAAAPHKGLYAPMGTGILIAGKPIEKTITEGGTGTASLSKAQPDDMPEKLESGTVNLPGIAGINAGIDFVKSVGADKIYRREMYLTAYLYEELSRIKKVKLYAPYPELYKFAPVLSFNISGKNSAEIAEYLNKNGVAVRAGFHCAALTHEKLGTLSTGAVRVSPGFFNTKNDIKYLVNLIKKS